VVERDVQLFNHTLIRLSRFIRSPSEIWK
jgi:hypothetical protein